MTPFFPLHSRRHQVRQRSAAVVTGLLLGAAVLAGCGESDGEEPVDTGCVPSGVSMSLAIGARANSPTPTLPKAVEELARSAARHRKAVSVVQVDGRPDIDLGPQIFSSPAEGERKYAKDLDRWVDGLRRWVTEMRADEPEVDVLKSLAVAAAQVKPGETVVLVDSALQTTPPLDFRSKGMLDADPKEVVDFLRRSNSVPDLTDRNVLLVGVGDTAPPQEELDVARRRQVIEIWTAVATAGGASCVELLESENSTPSDIDSPPVSLVPVPPLPIFAPCGDTVLSDQGSVGFIPDSAAFRDPAAARTTLVKLAEVLTRGNAQAELIGTTSSAGTEKGRQLLSEERARTVEAVLRELGVPEERLSSKGMGANWPDRKPDRGPDGALLPGPAAQNRSVIVRISCG
ncbi:OmpA family protein [Micromonospora sp. NPDC051196]|uniref:OmpA family protein n=1 Tax=Micromonospora sp. NPDC051196 TaxID=3155281 RepID=UPI003446D16D